MSADLVLRLRQLRLCEPYPINPDGPDAADEIERLRKMIRNAYNDGFIEGMRDVTSSRGGIPWGDCKYRAALEEVKK
jgi:hypothetical protein